MPHIKIWHFPTETTADQQHTLIAALTDSVVNAFGCTEDAVSIDTIPVPPDMWSDQVYKPEIETNRNRLLKTPGYRC